ncbi:transcriptional regulator, SarA/Rot family [Photobacterium leiognathi]|uniref:transcriptional regulator, SarA/Rot family n=1 Tax=Photobacterium leiognathi TaxID=553611 RepID=UPI002980E9DB|nr:hypothetical protein [Photobacterium leiognathi]
MIFEERICIEASPQDIYSLFTDVENWNQWDKEVDYSHLMGDFEIGTKGILKPSNGPKSQIVITNAIQNKRFTVTSKLPFCLLSFEHQLQEKGKVTEVVHRVKFSGLTSFLFGRFVGKEIYKGLPSTLEGLKKGLRTMFKYELPSNSIGLQLWVVYNKWHSEVMKHLKPLNINHTQFVILASILWCNKNKNETTQAELVNITGLDKMTLSKSMKTLVANDLIIKDKYVRDTRSFSLKLSETGEYLTKKAIAQVEKLDQQYFDSLQDKRAIFTSLLLGLKNS